MALLDLRRGETSIRGIAALHGILVGAQICRRCQRFGADPDGDGWLDVAVVGASARRPHFQDAGVGSCG